MKDCESVCEGAMVAAVNCNEIMLDIPSQERTSSPGQTFLFLHENARDFRFFCGPQTTPRSLTCTRLPLHSPIQTLGLGRVRGLIE